MTQILSSTLRLTPEQVETTIQNLAKCRHFTIVERLTKDECKPSYSEENVRKMKALGQEVNKITKFADNYIIYKFSKPEKNESVEELLKYNKDAKIKGLDRDVVNFVIVIDEDKFDKQFMLACSAFWPLIVENTNKNEKPEVIVCPNNLITTAISKHFNVELFPIKCSIFSLCDVYPLIGSKNQMFGFTKNYEVIEYEPLYNKLDYAVVMDNDPVVKILGAKAGDLIVCQHLLFETSPYWEYTIRRVKESIKEEYEEEYDDDFE